MPPNQQSESQAIVLRRSDQVEFRVLQPLSPNHMPPNRQSESQAIVSVTLHRMMSTMATRGAGHISMAGSTMKRDIPCALFAPESDNMVLWQSSFLQGLLTKKGH